MAVRRKVPTVADELAWVRRELAEVGDLIAAIGEPGATAVTEVADRLTEAARRAGELKRGLTLFEEPETQARLADFERRMAAGEVGPRRPIEEVIENLRRRLEELDAPPDPAE